jgi:hypothetical protein
MGDHVSFSGDSYRSIRRFLYEAVKKINLVEFIEREAGARFDKTGGNWMCVCPLPSHKDSKPSFSVVEKNDEDGVAWLYRCFGCGSSGTIIDFCMDYLAFDYPSEALLYVVEKTGIESSEDVAVKAIKETRVRVDLDKKMECSHFVAASNCRRLLRRFNGNRDLELWVAKSYYTMNSALDKGDVKAIERVGLDALKKLMGGENAGKEG